MMPRDQSRDLSPNASGGLTPLSPPSELQEIPVAMLAEAMITQNVFQVYLLHT